MHALVCSLIIRNLQHIYQSFPLDEYEMPKSRKIGSTQEQPKAVGHGQRYAATRLLALICACIDLSASLCPQPIVVLVSASTSTRVLARPSQNRHYTEISTLLAAYSHHRKYARAATHDVR